MASCMANPLHSPRGAGYTPAGTVTDIQGNVYKTVKIGDQTWMAENLKSARLNDGTPVIKGDVSNWKSLSSPGYCWSMDDSATYAGTYGALYNGFVVQSGKACPTGWHVPAESEWDTLFSYLGGMDVAGGRLKEAGSAHWVSPNIADNSSGFTALPGGSISDGGGRGGLVGFQEPGLGANWWTSTLSNPFILWNANIYSFFASVVFGESSLKYGLSIRCVMGESIPPVILPGVITGEISEITSTQALGKGVITSDGDGYISSGGLCWSLESNPDTSDFKTAGSVSLFKIQTVTAPG